MKMSVMQLTLEIQEQFWEAKEETNVIKSQKIINLQTQLNKLELWKQEEKFIKQLRSHKLKENTI